MLFEASCSERLSLCVFFFFCQRNCKFHCNIDKNELEKNIGVSNVLNSYSKKWLDKLIHNNIIYNLRHKNDKIEQRL